MMNDVSWDERIVPALRKRLECESRALSKRMSAASIDDSEPQPAHNGISTGKPSAIPRPIRTRTYSTPSSLPTPANSRPSSPLTPAPVKPTRIPKAARTPRPSGSNHGHAMRYPITPETSPDLWQNTHTQIHSDTNSTGSVPRHPNGHVLMHETPPFRPNSFSSEDDVERRSEEEHPFEHWYRGDLSRNGGVGELRVGNRVEMLQIANYGHRLRERLYLQNSYSRRKRAESIGGRESWYFDEADTRAVTERVIDEMPLTDMEGDSDTDTRRSYHSDVNISSIANADINIGNSGPSTHIPPKPSAIPRLASPAPTAMRTRSSTDSPSPPPPPSQSQSQSQLRAPSTPRGRAKSPATSVKSVKLNKKKPTAVRSKSAHARASSGAQSDGSHSPSPPLPTGNGGLEDAIPSWTQPVHSSKPWDEVVLPVVARNLGLEGQYERADGSPRPQKHDEEKVPPPAPGTFGFDRSKYRSPRSSAGASARDFGSLDEFGSMPPRISEEPKVEEEKPKAPSYEKSPPASPTDARRTSRSRSAQSPTYSARFRDREPSPLPFARYAQPNISETSNLGPQLANGKDTKLTRVATVEMHVEESPGCCARCVIM